MQSSSAYLKIFAASTLLLGVSFVGFNWLMDPYAIYQGPKVRGLNVIKSEVDHRLDLHKITTVRRLRPSAIILGNSRAEVLDPGHPGWRENRAYNLALPGARIYKHLQLMEYAQSVQPLKQVVLTLDFRSFRTIRETDLASIRKVRRPRSLPVETLPALFSVDTLLDSLRTIGRQEGEQKYLANGQRNGPGYWRQIQRFGGHRPAFFSAEMMHFKSRWKEFQRRPSGSEGAALHLDLEPFRAIVAASYGHNFDLRIFLPPLHARLWETMDAAGLWRSFEDLKRQLLRITEEEASRRQAEPFQLWDFSGYNSVTTETVPPLGDNQTQMTWHWESSHYQAALGDLVLDRVLDYKSPERPVVADLGVRLTSDSIEQHLARIRANRVRYRAQHKDAVREIWKHAGYSDGPGPSGRKVRN